MIYVNSMDIISKNIKYLRIKKGLSQNALANMLEKDRSSIAYWEQGKNTISLETLAKLTEILDVSILDIFCNDLENEEKENNKELVSLNKILNRNNILKNNRKLTYDEYNKIINFLKVNIKFIIDFEKNE